MVKIVVSTDDCGDCACWLCYCEADLSETFDVQAAPKECLETCQDSMKVALSVLGVWVFFFLVFALFRRPYLAAWTGALAVASAVIAAVMATDLPQRGEEDLVLTCQFPVDVIAYMSVLAVVGLVLGLIILNVWKARHGKQQREVAVSEDSEKAVTRRNTSQAGFLTGVEGANSSVHFARV